MREGEGKTLNQRERPKVRRVLRARDDGFDRPIDLAAYGKRQTDSQSSNESAGNQGDCAARIGEQSKVGREHA